MLIDWFTVIAQVVNFLILVWLLKHFLYRPILNAIDARENKIAKELADADAKKAEAQKQRDDFQNKNDEFDKQHNARMNAVVEEAKTQRAQLLDTARQEADDLRAKLHEALSSEQRNLNDAITRRARDEVFAIARKALTDLAGITLEERMTAIFLQRLRALDATVMAELISVFAASTHPLLIRTAFTLPADQCAAIETVIKEMLGQEKPLEFKTTPDLVSGIEISVDGQKIAWSIADYLASLVTSIDELLKTKTKINAGTESVAPADTAQEVDVNGN